MLEHGEATPQDRPRDVSDEARPRAGKHDGGDGGGQAAGRTGGTTVSEETADAPPVGRGNLGRRPAGEDAPPTRPGREDHR